MRLETQLHYSYSLLVVVLYRLLGARLFFFRYNECCRRGFL